MTLSKPWRKTREPPATSAKDDLKTLPMAEVEKRLAASADGLTQAEAQKRLAH